MITETRDASQVETDEVNDKVAMGLIPELDSKLVKAWIHDKLVYIAGHPRTFHDMMGTTETGRVYERIQKTGKWKICPEQEGL